MKNTFAISRHEEHFCNIKTLTKLYKTYRQYQDMKNTFAISRHEEHFCNIKTLTKLYKTYRQYQDMKNTFALSRHWVGGQPVVIPLQFGQH